MAVSVGLHSKTRTVTEVEGWPYRAVADAMEVIPRTLVQNAGGNAIRTLTELRVRAESIKRNLDFIPQSYRQSIRTGSILGALMATLARS